MSRQKQPLSQDDYDFFRSLASLYEAAVRTSVDPVVIGGMYYDCVDDKNFVRDTMRYRIEQAHEDIRLHAQTHRRLLQQFQNLQASVAKGLRANIVEHMTQPLIENIQGYVDDVKNHHRKHGHQAFLNYPYALGANIFWVQDAMDSIHEIGNTTFNQAKSQVGALGELLLIQQQAKNFQKRTLVLPSTINILSAQDSGKGIDYASLRGRLELNTELLKRTGFTY